MALCPWSKLVDVDVRLVNLSHFIPRDVLLTIPDHISHARTEADKCAQDTFLNRQRHILGMTVLENYFRTFATIDRLINLYPYRCSFVELTISLYHVEISNEEVITQTHDNSCNQATQSSLSCLTKIFRVSPAINIKLKSDS